MEHSESFFSYAFFYLQDISFFHKGLVASDRILEGDVDTLRFSKPKIATLGVFYGFLMNSGNMRTPDH